MGGIVVAPDSIVVAIVSGRRLCLRSYVVIAVTSCRSIVWASATIGLRAYAVVARHIRRSVAGSCASGGIAPRIASGARSVVIIVSPGIVYNVSITCRSSPVVVRITVVVIVVAVSVRVVMVPSAITITVIWVGIVSPSIVRRTVP